jgi:hypothetical protein
MKSPKKKKETGLPGGEIAGMVISYLLKYKDLITRIKKRSMFRRKKLL